MILTTLPPHTCYVEVWPGPSSYQRLFHKVPAPVNVCNDQGATATLFRLLREQPVALLATMIQAGVPSTEGLHCWQLLRAWYASQQMDMPSRPRSIDAFRAELLAPYQRLRTALFEALPWRDCVERYNDPRALLMLEPPWGRDERDEWAALSLRLARARFQWRLLLPHDIWTQQRSLFPHAFPIAETDDLVWLAPCR